MKLAKNMKKFVPIALCFAVLALACSCSATPTSSSVSNSGTSTSGSSETENKPTEIVVTINPGIAPDNGGGTTKEVLQKADANMADSSHGQTWDMVSYKIAANTMALMDKENITVNYVSWGWDTPLIQKQTAALLAGAGPDVFTGEMQMPGFAQQGQLAPFPDWLADYVRKNIVKGAYSAMEFDGKIYGCCETTGVSVLFWNKAILTEVGLDPDKAPTTWEELISNCQKIYAYDNHKYNAGGFYAAGNAGGWLRLGPFMIINGGNFIDDTGAPAFNTKENVGAFQLMRDLANCNPAGHMANVDYNNFFNPYLQGKQAYTIDGPWVYGQSKDAGLDFGMSQLPISATGSAGNLTIAAGFYGVPAYSKNQDAAFKFIKALLDKSTQQIVADGGSMPCMDISIAENATYKYEFPWLYDQYVALKGNVKGCPTFLKNNDQTWQIFGDAMVKVQMTTESVQDILDDAQEQAAALQK